MLNSTTGRRVLVVDDNRDAADSMAMVLKISGHSASVAYDGQEAIDLAEAERPDLMLLDIGLPTLNGYEVCRRIREEAWGASLVVVALTSWGQEEYRRRSREAGFNGHLVKPIEFRTLETLLASVPPLPHTWASTYQTR